MTETVKVLTLKGFNNTGGYVKRNQQITVDEQRARELERNGLVTRQLKAAPVAENKMAPQPENKGAPGNTDGATEDDATDSAGSATTPAEQLVASNADDVIAALAEEKDKELLQAALDAEKAGKGRKTVLAALDFALKAD